MQEADLTIESDLLVEKSVRREPRRRIFERSLGLENDLPPNIERRERERTANQTCNPI